MIRWVCILFVACGGCSSQRSDNAPAVPPPAPVAPPAAPPPSPPPEWDWNDECPPSPPNPVPVDPSYGAAPGESVVAFAVAEMRRLIVESRDREPLRNSHARSQLVQSTCRQYRYVAQERRLEDYLTTIQNSDHPEQGDINNLNVDALYDLSRCVSGMRNGQALAACDRVESVLRRFDRPRRRR